MAEILNQSSSQSKASVVTQLLGIHHRDIMRGEEEEERLSEDGALMKPPQIASSREF